MKPNPITSEEKADAVDEAARMTEEMMFFIMTKFKNPLAAFLVIDFARTELGNSLGLSIRGDLSK